MSKASGVSNFYSLGSRLASYLPQSGQASPQVVLGLLSDLVGDEQALLAPLRHLVGLPGFNDLLRRAGTGTGLHERDALLQTIVQTYSSAVVIALGQFLDGLLALPVSSAAPSQPKPVTVAQHQKPEPGASANPYPSPSSYTQTSVEQGHKPRGAIIPLLVLSVVTGLFTATTAVALRSGALCSFGIGCAPSSSLAVLQGLDAATKAGQEMEKAPTFAAYGQALKILEGQLLSLKALAPKGSRFTAEQTQLLARLQSLATDGHSRLATEQLDQERLQQLNTEVYALGQMEPGQELKSRLAQAASSLGAISPKSFSYARARELQSRLDGFLVDARPQPSNSSAAGGTSTPVVEPAPNQREMRSETPTTAPQPAPRTSGDGSTRSEPLF